MCDGALFQTNPNSLSCKNCHNTFVIEDGYLNLLLPKIKKEICSKSVAPKKIAKKLKQNILSKNEHDIIHGMLASKFMSRQYFQNVVHPTQAAWSARSYERFEELFIVTYLDKILQKHKVTFVDMGSGPGRYMILLGSKMLKDSCQELKKNSQTRHLYGYDSAYAKNLKHVIGVDYSEEMTGYSTQLVSQYGLGRLLDNRIFPVAAVAQNFNLNANLLSDTYKVVVCTFQTLGNQQSTELQIQMLKSMKKLVHPHGTIIISVFNKKLFRDFGLKKFYGSEVKKTVGNIITSRKDVQNSILRTNKGVYSKWFSRDDLQELFLQSGIKHFTIMDESSLDVIPGYEEYLSVEDQKSDVFPRAIMGVAKI